ncbi:MAG: DUF503 domain-containing protein [Pseudomonadota bacterium]
MFVGVARVVLLIHEGNSLKDKRSVRRKLIERLKAKFNASVAEVGGNDLLRHLEIGIGVVGNDRAFVNSCLDNLLNYLDELQLAEIIETDTDILNV